MLVSPFTDVLISCSFASFSNALCRLSIGGNDRTGSGSVARVRTLKVVCSAVPLFLPHSNPGCSAECPSASANTRTYTLSLSLSRTHTECATPARGSCTTDLNLLPSFMLFCCLLYSPTFVAAFARARPFIRTRRAFESSFAWRLAVRSFTRSTRSYCRSWRLRTMNSSSSVTLFYSYAPFPAPLKLLDMHTITCCPLFAAALVHSTSRPQIEVIALLLADLCLCSLHTRQDLVSTLQKPALVSQLTLGFHSLHTLFAEQLVSFLKKFLTLVCASCLPKSVIFQFKSLTFYA